jgi:hypothetical protein
MAIYAYVLIDAGAFGTSYLAVLMLAINRGKAIQVRDGISPNRLLAFLLISRTHCTMFIFHQYRGMPVPPPHE